MDKALARGGAVWHDPLLPYKQLNRHSPASGSFASRIALVTSSDNGKSPSSREKGGRTRQLAAPNAVMRRFVGTEAYFSPGATHEPEFPRWIGPAGPKQGSRIRDQRLSVIQGPATARLHRH